MRDPVVSLRIDPDVWAQVKAAAKAEGVTASEWTREACVRRLNRPEPPKAHPGQDRSLARQEVQMFPKGGKR